MLFLRRPAAKRALSFAAALVLAALPGARAARAAFDIVINSDTTVTPEQQAYFNQAAATWESLITGYQPGISISSLVIDATVTTIDGAGGILGGAAPDTYTTQAGFTLPTHGIMQFDVVDVPGRIANGTFGAIVLHEIAHVMGLGTLWTDNGVYVNGSGRYTGANALATYRQEFIGQFAAAFVPVELGGGGGTANGHWDEVDGGVGLTGRVSVLNGQDMRNELMTGWLDSPTFISNTTIASFRDIGYTTVSTAVVPEAPTLPLAAAGLPLLGLTVLARRRRPRPARATS
jgi:hypothetical protein